MAVRPTANPNPSYIISGQHHVRYTSIRCNHVWFRFDPVCPARQTSPSRDATTYHGLGAALLAQPTVPQTPVHQATTAWSKEPKISSPPPFSGRKDEALEFLLKCDMVFDVQPRTSSSTKAKIAFVTNLLKDEAYRCHILSFRRPTSQPGSMAIPISLRLHNKSSRSSNNRRRQPVTPLSSPALPPIFIGMMRRSVTLTSMV